MEDTHLLQDCGSVLKFAYGSSANLRTIQKCGEQSQDNSEICQVIFFIISVVVIVLAEYHSASPFRTVHTVVLMNTLDVTMDPACSTL